jgi:predicted nucleic acid-binding Zn ribbon protein
MYHYTGSPRICEVCGKEYPPKSHTQKYCSTKCKMKVASTTFRAKNPEYLEQYFKRRREANKRGIPRLKENSHRRKCDSCKKYHRGRFNYCHACITRKANHIADGCEAMI